MAYENQDNGGIQRVAVVGTAGTGLADDALPVEWIGTDVRDCSANANGLFTLTLPAVAGKTNYLSGIIISGSGASAASSQYALLTGVGPFDMYLHFTVPAGVATTTTMLELQFARPLAATAANQAITLQVPAFGAGNTLEAAIIWGFYR